MKNVYVPSLPYLRNIFFALIIIFSIIYKLCLLVAQNKIEMASNNIQIVITINEEELLHACSE
jgi:hypothetical protein